MLFIVETSCVFMVLSLYRRFFGKTNVPIAVLAAYIEKEYEPFDSYPYFYPAMPVSVCFSDTALYTLSKSESLFFTFLHLLRTLYAHIPITLCLDHDFADRDNDRIIDFSVFQFSCNTYHIFL